MKHVFKTPHYPMTTIINDLIDICTADGSVVSDIKVDYEYGRLCGADTKIIIWTKKTKDKK